MKYKVLYRKYRPETFENIIGQDYIIETLKNSIKNESISHAYIFSGPRGTGKTTTAKVFAKAINCASPIDGSPCEKCEFCVHFHENPDIIEIDAASNNGVDEIRQLIENIKLTPTNGKYKVYIIDEVHMLTTSAFNALLLTLEEPPAHSIFILATTNIESVPITILSRCQRFDFQKIKNEDIVKHITDICAMEKINIEKSALKEISYLAEGGMRDALSLLDQLSKGKDKITLEFVEKQFKIVSQKTVQEFLEYVEDNNVDACLKLIDEFRQRSADYKNLIKKIIEQASTNAKNIVLSNQQKRLSITDYKNLILELVDSLNKININVDSYTILEMIILNYFNISSKDIVETKEVENKENIKIVQEDNNLTKQDKEKPKDNIDNLVEIRINNCFFGAQKKYLEEIKKKLDDLILTSKITGKSKGILIDSTLVTASDKYLIFEVKNNHNASLANRMLNEIEDVLKKNLGYEYKIIFLDEERWLKEKEEYIKNIKLKKEYKFIEEPKVEEIPEINDVFDKSKVEII